MPAIVTIKADNKIYLMTTKDNCVQAFSNLRQGLDYFEVGYNRNHGRSYEASISACINNMTFQPSIHEWDEEDLSKLIEMDVIVMDTFRGYRMSHVSGFMSGAILTGNKAEEFHENGLKPKLIAV